MGATDREYRESRKLCVVAGDKLVNDLSKRYRFHTLLSCVDDAGFDAQGVPAQHKYLAYPTCLKIIAHHVEFKGLVGSLELPQLTRSASDLGDPRLMLCLDNITDPGLLGTLLRTAVSFQWQVVFFLPGCCDPWHPTCIRASQGALFEIPFLRGTMDRLQKFCAKKDLELCVSHHDGADIGSASYQPPPKGLALLLREEYASPFAPPRMITKIKVPDPWAVRRKGPPDGVPFEPRSLDVAVAGGILMNHIKNYHYPHLSQSALLRSPKSQ